MIKLRAKKKTGIISILLMALLTFKSKKGEEILIRDVKFEIKLVHLMYCEDEFAYITKKVPNLVYSTWNVDVISFQFKIIKILFISVHIIVI